MAVTYELLMRALSPSSEFSVILQRVPDKLKLILAALDKEGYNTRYLLETGRLFTMATASSVRNIIMHTKILEYSCRSRAIWCFTKYAKGSIAKTWLFCCVIHRR